MAGEYKRQYEKRVWRAYEKELFKVCWGKIKSLLLNYQPFNPGVLPYDSKIWGIPSQESIKKRFRGYKPRRATLASAIGLGALSAAALYLTKDADWIGLGFWATAMEWNRLFGYYTYQYFYGYEISKAVVQAILGYLVGDSVVRGIWTWIKKRPVGNLIAESLTYLNKRLAPRTRAFKRAQEEVKKELEEEARQETVYESLTCYERAREEISELSYKKLAAEKSGRKELAKSYEERISELLERRLGLRGRRFKNVVS